MLLNEKLLSLIKQKMFEVAGAINSYDLHNRGYTFTEKGINHLVENTLKELTEEISNE